MVTLFSEYLRDDNKIQTGRIVSYLPAIHREDAALICEELPRSEGDFHATLFRRQAEIVARVYCGDGKSVYLTESTLKRIAEEYIRA